MKFKVGDRVKCIDDDNIKGRNKDVVKLNNIYTIGKCIYLFDEVVLKEIPTWYWRVDRFILVPLFKNIPEDL